MKPLLTAVILLARLAHASETPGLVAVLPFASQPDIAAVERLTLEESIRTSAGNTLTPRGYTVLANETTLRVLADNGADVARICEASCALEAARELQTKVFVSGSLARLEGVYIAFVRLFDSTNGQQLASVRLEDATLRGILTSLDAKAGELFSVVGAEPLVQAPPLATITPVAPRGSFAPALVSLVAPGVGQMLNGETTKGIVVLGISSALLATTLTFQALGNAAEAEYLAFDPVSNPGDCAGNSGGALSSCLTAKRELADSRHGVAQGFLLAFGVAYLYAFGDALWNGAIDPRTPEAEAALAPSFGPGGVGVRGVF